MNVFLPSLSLAATFLVSIYLLSRAWTSPKPQGQKEAAWKTDTVMKHLSLSRRNYMLAFVYSVFVIHAVLAILSPATRAVVCPHPEHLDSKLLTWNMYTAFFFGSILVSVHIRITAYNQLGANFTYELAKPQGLVKTGFYAHVRHRSYSPVFVCYVGGMWLSIRLGGVAGCFAPDRIVSSSVLGISLDVCYLWLMGSCLLLVLVKRVREKETMLASVFREEWKE